MRATKILRFLTLLLAAWYNYFGGDVDMPLRKMNTQKSLPVREAAPAYSEPTAR
jgi:hypothetical protein